MDSETAKHTPRLWDLSGIQVLIVSIVVFAAYVFGILIGRLPFDNEYEYQNEAVERGYAEWVIEDPREKPAFRWKDSE